jgi:hypothetical protein
MPPRLWLATQSLGWEVCGHPSHPAPQGEARLHEGVRTQCIRLFGLLPGTALPTAEHAEEDPGAIPVSDSAGECLAILEELHPEEVGNSAGGLVTIPLIEPNRPS